MDIESFRSISFDNGLDLSDLFFERRFRNKIERPSSPSSSDKFVCAVSCKYCLHQSSNSLSRLCPPSKDNFSAKLLCSLCGGKQVVCLLCARIYRNEKDLQRHFEKDFHKKRVRQIVRNGTGCLQGMDGDAFVPLNDAVLVQKQSSHVMVEKPGSFYDENSFTAYSSEEEFDEICDKKDDEETIPMVLFDSVDNPEFSEGMINSINRHKIHASMETAGITVDSSIPEGTPNTNSSAVDLLNLRLVVGRALGFRTEKDACMIHPLDASLHVIFTSFMEGLTQKKQDDLLFILRLNDVVRRETLNHDVKTSLPLTRKELDRSYLKGTNSIKKNLNEVGAYSEKGFAYSLVKHYVDSLMIRCGPCNSFSVLDEDEPTIVRTALDSKRSRQLLREMRDECTRFGLKVDDVVPVLLAIWDDGFDPSSMNNGIGSLNACTVSAIDFALGNVSRLNAFTDVVSLSRSTEDHDAVLGKLLAELQQLKKPFKSYHKHKGECYVIVRVLNCNRDRVQRNKVNFTLAHNGNCTQRWKYVLQPKGEDRQRFYSCEMCTKRSLISVIDVKQGRTSLSQPQIVVCAECDNFDVLCPTSQEVIIPSECPTNILKFSPTPPNYVPISIKNRRRKSFQHTMPELVRATKVAAYNLSLKNWSGVESDSYLREIGINSYVQVKVRKLAKKLKHLHKEEIMSYFSQNGYSDCVPNVWRFDDVCDIDSNIDPIMHMVFEGIVKVIVKEVFPTSFSLFGVKNQCMDLIQEQLILLQGMSIEWIRTERLSKKKLLPTGYKGDNFVAISRVLTNCISHVEEAIIQKGGGEMEERLRGYRCLEQFVCTCRCMICRIMCDECDENSIIDLDVHIKLFLTWSEKYCTTVENRELVDTFISLKGNFLSLLNIPNEMTLFGPLRRYWDGDYEKFVRSMKEVLPGGIHREGSSTLVSKLLRFKERASLRNAAMESFEYVSRQHLFGHDKKYERHQRWKVYASLDSIKNIIKNKGALSGVTLKVSNHNRSYIALSYKVHGKKRISTYSTSNRSEQSINCCLLKFEDNLGKWVAGSWYAPFNIITEKAYESEVTKSIIESQALQYICIVPKIDLKGRNQGQKVFFTCSDNWPERSNESVYETPRLQKRVFHSYLFSENT